MVLEKMFSKSLRKHVFISLRLHIKCKSKIVLWNLKYEKASHRMWRVFFWRPLKSVVTIQIRFHKSGGWFGGIDRPFIIDNSRKPEKFKVVKTFSESGLMSLCKLGVICQRVNQFEGQFRYHFAYNMRIHNWIGEMRKSLADMRRNYDDLMSRLIKGLRKFRYSERNEKRTIGAETMGYWRGLYMCRRNFFEAWRKFQPLSLC